MERRKIVFAIQLPQYLNDQMQTLTKMSYEKAYEKVVLWINCSRFFCLKKELFQMNILSIDVCESVKRES